MPDAATVKEIVNGGIGVVAIVALALAMRHIVRCRRGDMPAIKKLDARTRALRRRIRRLEAEARERST